MFYGFHDLIRFHYSSTVYWFLEFCSFKGFLKGLVILESTAISVWFFAFHCFGCFWVRDGRFMNFIRDLVIFYSTAVFCFRFFWLFWVWDK